MAEVCQEVDEKLALLRERDEHVLEVIQPDSAQGAPTNTVFNSGVHFLHSLEVWPSVEVCRLLRVAVKKMKFRIRCPSF